MKILSLFDGIGCTRVALERAGIPIEKYYASETDKYAIQIAEKNYPDTIQLGDIKEIDCTGGKLHYGMGKLAETDIDLICGGSPCQDLSIAKKNRKGLDGDRSGLFWEYVRILKEVKPKFFLLENVNSMPKEAKALITETLGVEPIMINAAKLSAQNRKRLFWCGKLVNGKYEKITIPQPEDRGILLKDILEQEVDEKYFVYSDNWRVKRNTVDVEGKSRCLNASNFKGALNDGMLLVPIHKQGTEKLKSNTVRSSGRCSGIDDKHNWDTIRIGQIGKGGQSDRIYSPEGKSVNLSARGGGRGAKTGLYAVAQRGRNIVDGKRKDILGAKTEQRIEIGQSDKAHTITSVFKDSMVMQDTQIRKLTPTECMRLQGLPDGYCDGVSNSQQYKMLGNAFNVDVVSWILSFILWQTK